MDPYKILQVDPEAEDEVIEAAYKRLARKYHPDVSPLRESQDRMVQLNQAWEQLRDRTRRAAVDRARTRTTGSAARVAAADAQSRTAGQPPATAPTHGAQGPQHRRAHAGGLPSPAGAGAGAQPGRAFGSTGEDQPEGTFSAAPASWAADRAMADGPHDTRSVRPQATGPAAGPAPGSPSGSVINFGRFAGWSLGEIARVEPEYLEWLDRMPIGRMYHAEIDALLRTAGLRSAAKAASRPRGLFRRR